MNFWLLCLSSFLFFGSFSMVIPELPGYLSSLGGEQYLGLIISLFTLTALISRPFSGRLTDQWGRIPVMVIGAVISCLAGLLYPMLTTVPGFLAIRLFHGFSTGFKPTGTSAFVADIVPKDRRGEALGILSMFGTTGMAIGPAIGSAIFLLHGINTLFYISSFFGIASVLVLAGIRETLEPRSPFRPAMLKISIQDIYEKSVLIPSLVMLLTTTSFGVALTLSPDFSVWLGIENKGLFYAFFTGSSLLVRIFGGRMSDRYGRVIVLRISTFILCISILGIGLSTNSFFFFGFAFLFGLGYGLNSPTLFAWAIDLTPDSSRGKGISTLFIALEIGIGMGALVSGTVFQGIPERFPIIFGGTAMFSLIAFFYMLSLKRR